MLEDAAATANLEREAAEVLALLSETTGLASRWNGVIERARDVDYWGRKPFDCRIVLNTALVGQGRRWSTLIHECLHTLSAGYVPADYLNYRGWEEGVVEQMQRLLRPDVLRRLNVAVPTHTFSFESDHLYNEYIGALEQIRLALPPPGAEGHAVAATPERFYGELLATPIRNRPGLILGRAAPLLERDRGAFVAVFSRANSVLTRQAR